MRYVLFSGLAAAFLVGPAQAQPVPVPSDPRASYVALDIKPKPRGMVEVLTRRDGPSGVSFSLREIDCGRRTFRYIGEGDTRDEVARASARSRPGNTMGPLTDGSISTHVANFACVAKR
jgi:hypothetical protein